MTCFAEAQCCVCGQGRCALCGAQCKSCAPASAAAENTDRELWREREGDYYADSLSVTKGGGIGINCGGSVIVRTLRVWHDTAAERDRLRAEVERLTARERTLLNTVTVHAGACRNLRAEKAELTAALDKSVKLQSHYAKLLNMHDGGRRFGFAGADEWLARLRDPAKATATEGGDDDVTDPTTTGLLKPRGNGGVVSADICFDALLLIGVDTQGIAPDSWTQAELARAYDWAMRVYAHASDNDAVPVPPRPHYIPRATEGGQ